MNPWFLASIVLVVAYLLSVHLRRHLVAPSHPCPQCGGLGEVPVRGFGAEEWVTCASCGGSGEAAA